MDAEEADGNWNQKGTDCGNSGENICVVLGDALDDGERIERRAVFRLVGHRDQSDETHVLSHEDETRNEHVCLNFCERIDAGSLNYVKGLMREARKCQDHSALRMFRTNRKNICFVSATELFRVR